jgi:CubicO group peptidase (beta-lactamase class C family)
MKKLLLLLSLCLFYSSCYVGHLIIYNFASINDYKEFPYNPVNKPDVTFSFIHADSGKRRLPDSISWEKKRYSLEDFLEKNKTVAFLLIKNDTVYYENYFHKYSAASIVPSFSMAKSFVSALVGCAVDDGYIKSVQQPITDYLPEFKDKKGFDKITIENLLEMRSGIKFNERYFNPFGTIVKYYYGRNIKKYLSHLKVGEEPDKHFEYLSVNSQLLGLIVEKATGKSLSEYLEEKIWKPLGMEYDASWSIDSKKHKTEKAYCCINARARDYAKFGRLYLDKGNWNGKQIISKDWVEKSTDAARTKKQYFYSYQWWHTGRFHVINDTTEAPPHAKIHSYKNKKGEIRRYIETPDDFYAEGLLGQFIYVYPSKNIIIVRLGKREGKVNWSRFFRHLCEQQ